MVAEMVMELGLCMTVRNEARNIVECLEPIIDLFVRVVIIDTGSTDGTQSLLRSRFGIEPLVGELDESDCLALASHRNRGFDLLGTPWIMTLDADERVDREELLSLMALDVTALSAGLFCAWDTWYGNGELIEDYKLCIFRGGHRHQGRVHDTAQPCLRQAGARADWTDRMRIRHFPDPSRAQEKRDAYLWRLACARRRDPEWLRYDWFLGQRCFAEGRFDDALEMLMPLHERRPALFPVESLNASMLIVAIHAMRGRTAETRRVLIEALDYHALVAEDFEVRVNFRLRPWLEEAFRSLESGRLGGVRPYDFPY